MTPNFDQALNWVLMDEGGNDDDPQDHGGRTSRGITQREYDAWRTEQGKPKSDVWAATPEEIRTIYYEEYWQPEGAWLTPGVDYLFFDFKVNAGPRRAIITLQRALGVTDDGRIGPVTRQALTGADPARLIEDYSTAKESFYRSLHQPRFLKGWLNRVVKVRERSRSLLGGAS